MSFNQRKAVRRYAELMRLIGLNVYPENDSISNYYEDFDIGKSISNLEKRAARFGFKFVIEKDICRLEPLIEEEKTAYEDD
jgi:hypothetical protein